MHVEMISLSTHYHNLYYHPLQKDQILWWFPHVRVGYDCFSRQNVWYHFFVNGLGLQCNLPKSTTVRFMKTFSFLICDRWFRLREFSEGTQTTRRFYKKSNSTDPPSSWDNLSKAQHVCIHLVCLWALTISAKFFHFIFYHWMWTISASTIIQFSYAARMLYCQMELFG